VNSASTALVLLPNRRLRRLPEAIDGRSAASSPPAPIPQRTETACTELRIEIPAPDATLAALNALRSWPEGWDGAGALTPNPHAVGRARRFVEALARFVIGNGGEFLTPNVTASVDGEVVFEWWHWDRKLTLYVGESGISYVRVWGPDVENEMVAGELQRAATALDLWHWLTSR
jgi:hypothetical protein